MHMKSPNTSRSSRTRHVSMRQMIFMFSRDHVSFLNYPERKESDHSLPFPVKISISYMITHLVCASLSSLNVIRVDPKVASNPRLVILHSGLCKTLQN